MKPGLILLAAAVGLAVATVLAGRAPAAAAPAAAAPAEAPGLVAPPAQDKAGDKTAGAAAKAGKPGMEVFLLPANYRNADGTFNEEAIVAQQKKRLEVINEKLHDRLRLTETAHYLVFSDADAATTGQFVKWSEALYGHLCAQFSIDPKERIWDGKCMLLVFATRPKFLAFAREFDDNNASDAGAFFAWEHYAPNYPELVHISIPLDERDPRRLQELFAHEGTHAFFQLYRKPVELPLWLHEGLAEYMTTVNDPALKPLKSAAAVRLAREKAPLDRLLAAKAGDDLKLQDYSVAYTLVEFLQAAGGRKFKDFIGRLKDGKDQNAAMKAAYGFDTEGLVQRWRAALTAEPAAPKRR